MTADTPRTPEEHLDAVRALLGVRPVADVPVCEAVGHPLATAVLAVEDAPRFDNSQMDGYALGSRHLAGGRFPVGPVIAAGADPAAIVPLGLAEAVVPVMTGAKLPAGTAAVVPVEWCTPGEFGASTVVVPTTPAGQFMRLRGSDTVAGAELLPAGHVVNARTVGVASAQGITTLPVHRPARVLICTGGDEVGDGHGAGSGVAMIRDANAPMLDALCRQAGIRVVGHVRTTDDPVAFGALLTAAVRRTGPDAVITSGGISHGQFEVVRQLLSSTPGAWFGHVAQQPGGPQGLVWYDGVPVVCLPGNPVSTMVSFRLFVAPVLGVVPEVETAVLAGPVTGQAHKDSFHRAVRSVVDGMVQVQVVGGAGSHLLAQSVTADCLLRVPAGTAPVVGDVMTVYPL
ncbi:molybdopterin molybdotransferase MoeA [Corynebacterium terpenotabidum]|uniref:Molybdopterin molybdenumtransferase n=1 Tax=Corynebacterium terpenotabidum Y-11 TaxID=1200352 RepID=S4XG65_9CORY|nr:molybdopterin molybdotransferase MoeA [Corynebacterium terpenotabidum]AGP31569.1 molybdopterin biosynthesis protein [Corynebacterium terpenotabidum Y-11]